jgi:poly(3-hydroxybutyrate) depolymerase
MLGMLVGAAIPHLASASQKIVNVDSFHSALSINYQRPQLQPLSGKLQKNFAQGRVSYIYIPKYAPLRARFTVIAVPNRAAGNVWGYLTAKQWLKEADKKGEGLYILTPGSKGWGGVEEEKSYLTSAMSFLQRTKNASNISILSTHGTYGAVGYEEGCAPLEWWVVNNPLYIYAQTYIKGKGIDEKYFAEAEQVIYGGNFPGSLKLTADEFTYALANIGIAEENLSRKSTVPIPSWFVDYNVNDKSIEYWKKANDCETKYKDGIYHQSLASKAWQTEYANRNIKSWGGRYGISQVRVSGEKVHSAADIVAFLSAYRNYTAICPYSNNLDGHMDYSMATQAAFRQAEKVANGAKARQEVSYTDFDGKPAKAKVWALESTRVQYPNSTVGANLYAGSIAVTDYDKDGKNDPREFLLYVPDSAKANAPLIYVSPGMTQTAQTFLDVCGWVPIANDAGCVLAVITEPYMNATTVGYTFAKAGFQGDDAEGANFARALMSFLKKDFKGAKIDWSRVYASGHSAGSNASQQLALVSDSDWLAAVGSTSLFTRSEKMSAGLMPTYVMLGQVDINDKNVDMFHDPYVAHPTYSTATNTYEWLHRILTKNKLKASYQANDKASFIKSCSSTQLKGRYVTYNWANDQGIDLVKFGRTLLREHNCYPEEFRLIWNYVQHFSLEKKADGKNVRYYSKSAFKSNDKIELK